MNDLNSKLCRPQGFRPHWQGALCLLLLSFGLDLRAQEVLPEQEPELEAPEPVVVLEDIPDTRHLAAALSDRASRNDTLMTIIAVSRLLDYGYTSDSSQLDALEARFREERAWLDRLAARYIELPMRGSLLDPPAWYLLLELDQQQLEPDHVNSPLGPDTVSLTNQLFDRSDDRLAAALLPELLPRMELVSTALWGELMWVVSANEPMSLLVNRLNSDWFDPWMAAEPPAPGKNEEHDSLVADSLAQLTAFVEETVATGPPDVLRLKRLRFNLLSALPELGADQAQDAEYLLILASAIDGLRDNNYLPFTESLLWVASSLLLNQQARLEEVPEEPVGSGLTALEELPEDDSLPEQNGETLDMPEVAFLPADENAAEEIIPPEPYQSPLPRALSDWLPVLSNHFSGEFSEVDSRINSSLAAVYDVVQYLQSGEAAPERLSALRLEMANAVAQLVLLIPDMGFYFDQPVRERISEEVGRCIAFFAEVDPSAGGGLSRDQFDSCLGNMAGMANELLSEAELAGDTDGPFGMEQLRRELVMTPWQRINFALGYMEERFSSGCEAPPDPLPNPLEWSNLATTISWFARQSPVYFQTPENEALVLTMRQQGMDLLESLVQQVDCISGTGAGINDPVVRSLVDYRASLDALVAGLREAELTFRSDVLKPGSDVVLHGDAAQSTAFRPEELLIGPCDAGRTCEMSTTIEPTRALVGLFPDTYLIADQTGLGEVEICYDNVQWVNRRSEPVRADDPHVANYFGQLSFELIGKYHEKDQVTSIFGFNFVSPTEYHYLFGAATEEVLEDSCPTEWVGTRIVTPMNSDSVIRVVPNRLTYLTAARSLPSRIINSNWSRNEEWRDSFITGRNVSRYSYPPDQEIADRVNQNLQNLYQSEQSAIYNALLRPPRRSKPSEMDSLFILLDEVTTRKALVRTYMNLFYPQVMIDSDEIRGSLQGYSALLDRMAIRRYRQENKAVSSVNQVGLARLERFQAQWNRMPEAVRRSGSIATSLAHAITRLNTLYGEFFVLPAQRVENETVPVTLEAESG